MKEARWRDFSEVPSCAMREDTPCTEQILHNVPLWCNEPQDGRVPTRPRAVLRFERSDLEAIQIVNYQAHYLIVDIVFEL